MSVGTVDADGSGGASESGETGTEMAAAAVDEDGCRGRGWRDGRGPLPRRTRTVANMNGDGRKRGWSDGSRGGMTAGEDGGRGRQQWRRRRTRTTASTTASGCGTQQQARAGRDRRRSEDSDDAATTTGKGTSGGGSGGGLER